MIPGITLFLAQTTKALFNTQGSEFEPTHTSNYSKNKSHSNINSTLFTLTVPRYCILELLKYLTYIDFSSCTHVLDRISTVDAGMWGSFPSNTINFYSYMNGEKT